MLMRRHHATSTSVRRHFGVICLLGLFVSVACQECSTVSLSNSTGWITSPDYDRDGLYENNLLCLWVIYADDNEIIRLEFLEMDIEFDQKCRYDYLDVSFILDFCQSKMLQILIKSHLPL